MRGSLSFAAGLGMLLAVGCAPGPAPTDILPNDQTVAAGTLQEGVLTVALEAREGNWHPEGPNGKSLDSVAAFAEAGKPMSTPGPMIRVPAGTEVRGTLVNTLARPLTVFGLGKTRGYSDSMVVAPGDTAAISFRAESPGTYYYLARSRTDPFGFRLPEDTQLNGVIVVDGPDAKPDRVFAITWLFTLDSMSRTGLGRGTMAINGLSWPHTERLAYTQNDSIHWRVVNFTEVDHPMHLHGFYFQTTARGTGVQDTIYDASQRRMAVTEVVLPFQTIALSWQAERAGNWIYHCHYANHLSDVAALDMESGVFDHANLETHGSDRPHQMFGLVIGLTVAPQGAEAAAPEPDRRIRLVQREKPGVYGNQAGMSFVMDGTPEASDPDAMPVPGPLMVLERGKRVAVTIVNQSKDQAAVHWHGIELESYPDGVPGWSGSGRNILPAIAPGDSLTVYWTPPRAGSFMYHSHFSEALQMGSGLYGPIVVVEPGQSYDPETDRIFFFGTAGTVENVIVGPFPSYVLNGSTAPGPIELKAGTRYRFRFFNLAGDLPTLVSLNGSAGPAEWRLVAKDGYPTAENQSKVQPSVLVFDPGEIYDYEFVPARPGRFTLSYGVPPFPPPPPPEPGAPPLPAIQLPPTVNVEVIVR